ncbi:hypothetical protein WMY93_010956 [Mugilogobius chulae]|uniref:Carbonic anhydrase n=1 Tax=Mugilogobius chulae TaxID=88201 RepID=A0AAW0P8U1_9GOBI
MLHILFTVLPLCWVVSASTSAAEWCYSGCDHTPSHWADIQGAFCGGIRQSPVDIVTSEVKTDALLGNFTFMNFTSREVFDNIVNTGETEKVNLKTDTVEFYGGGLNGTYSVLQFHFHWGDTEHHPGSEHLMNGKRFDMEMHVVSVKKGYTTEQAVTDKEGIAVLGFFIEVVEQPKKLFSTKKKLNHFTNNVSLTDAISINDLIGDVDLTKFYRYKGSLTTPMCNEAVLWTVFEEPIQVNAELLQLFPTKTGVTNVYRPSQGLKGRQVYASPAVQLPPSQHWCYDEHECDYGPGHWGDLTGSFCAGTRQSPIKISSNDAVVDNLLDAFHFKNFDLKSSIEYVTNTGHTVKCVLKEGLVEVSGGGLGHVYSVLQFHYHWADNTSDSQGSEHLIDSKRYPMEMHIVTKRKDLTLDEAVRTNNGLAVLGFLIEASGEMKSSSASSAAETSSQTVLKAGTSAPSNTEIWKLLTNYLSHIKDTGTSVQFTSAVSIDDLLGDVDRGSYFRYNGSLTTPNCNEAVVWTVFKQTIKVEHNLMQLFPNTMGYHNVYRPVQTLQGRTIYTSAADASFHPTLLVLLLTCAFVRCQTNAHGN